MPGPSDTSQRLTHISALRERNDPSQPCLIFDVEIHYIAKVGLSGMPADCKIRFRSIDSLVVDY